MAEQSDSTSAPDGSGGGLAPAAPLAHEGKEFSGKTVDDAISKALTEFGLPRNEVAVEVRGEGRPGILGVGAQPARVLVTPIPAPVSAPAATAAPSTPVEPDRSPASRPAAARRGAEREAAAPAFDEQAADNFVNEGAGQSRALPTEADYEVDGDLVTASAADVLRTLLQLMGFDAEVTPRSPESAGDGAGMMSAVLDVTGIADEEMGLLIGRRGETLSALQYLLNLMVNHQTNSRRVFGVDVEGYRRRRESSLRDLALRIADRVRQNGQAMTLEPMPPAERRIVHIALADDPDVQTVSIGEGDARKVAITPRH